MEIEFIFCDVSRVEMITSVTTRLVGLFDLVKSINYYWYFGQTVFDFLA